MSNPKEQRFWFYNKSSFSQFGIFSLENKQTFKCNHNTGKVIIVTGNKLVYNMQSHVNETITLKIANILVSVEGDNNSETLHCHPYACVFCLEVPKQRMHVFQKEHPASRSRKLTLHMYSLILISVFVGFVF